MLSSQSGIPRWVSVLPFGRLGTPTCLCDAVPDKMITAHNSIRSLLVLSHVVCDLFLICIVKAYSPLLETSPFTCPCFPQWPFYTHTHTHTHTFTHILYKCVYVGFTVCVYIYIYIYIYTYIHTHTVKPLTDHLHRSTTSLY